MSEFRFQNSDCTSPDRGYLLIATLAVTWPRVPCTLLQFGAPAAMVLAPIVLYPFSKLGWLAFDLILRPGVPNDLASPATTR
jgi:hypothetical protein